MATVVAALAALRDAPDIADLVAASDNARHGAFEIPAVAFELNLVEGDPITARTNLFGIAAVLEVHVPESEIMRFIADRPAAGPDGLTFGLAITTIIIAMAIMTVAITRRIPDRGIALRANAKLQGAISGLNGDTTSDVFARRTMVRQCRCCEEQRRRKGERGCSGFHDTFHHGCRNTHLIST